MASTFSTSTTIVELIPNPGYKEIVIITPDTFEGVDGAAQIRLLSYGITTTAGTTLSSVFSVSAYEISGSGTLITCVSRTVSLIDDVLTISGDVSRIGGVTNVFRVTGKGA